MNSPQEIRLPLFSYVDLGTSVSISGTWIGTGEENVASKKNTNKITCNFYSQTCQMLQAELFNDNFLSIYSEELEIESWNDNFIIFITAPGSSNCVNWTYRIDRFKKEVLGNRTKASDYDYNSCMGIGLDEFEIKLVDGLNVYE